MVENECGSLDEDLRPPRNDKYVTKMTKYGDDNKCDV